MSTNWLPTRESDLLTWTREYLSVCRGQPADYGLTAEQVSTLTEAKDAFALAHATANNPITRSPANVEIKNEKKAALVALVRELVRVNQSWPAMTNAKRAQLGISLRGNEPTPIPAPEVAPQLDITGVTGRTVHLRVRDAESGKRRKPEGVYAVTILRYVGSTIPEDMDEWVFVGNETRLDAKVTLADRYQPGTQVWFTAFWTNRRGESGPACIPLSTHLGYGVITARPEEVTGDDGPGSEDLRMAA
jgi:hypothetical protein